MALQRLIVSSLLGASAASVLGSGLYFGGKSLLRCSAVEEVTDPQKIEWFHNDQLIYVAEIQAQRNGIHFLSHAPSESWGSRALFYPKTRSLRLARLTPQDAGVYTCRVIGSSEAVNNTFYVRGPMMLPQLRMVSKSLNASVNPRAQSQEVGPLFEDENVAISCEADPSYPEAQLMWFAINEDMQYSSLTRPERGHSDLRIERLGRRHDGIRFSCWAEDELTGERHQSTIVKLDIYFRPLGITTSKNKVLFAWENSELECVVSGSRPPPSIHWKFGYKRVEPTFTHTSFDGNVTTTSVSFEPRPEHHGIAVSCHASNAAFPKDVLFETWNLTVHYAPLVELYPYVGNSEPVVPEGQKSKHTEFIFDSTSRLSLRCRVLANPAPSKIRWRHEGSIIVTNKTSTILRISPPLTEEREGEYTCTVENSVAEVSSSPVHIRVRNVSNNAVRSEQNSGVEPPSSIVSVAGILVPTEIIVLLWIYS